MTYYHSISVPLRLESSNLPCQVPRPYYCARTMYFGSRGPSKIFSITSPKCIDREGLGKRRIGIICPRGCFSDRELMSGPEVVLQEGGLSSNSRGNISPMSRKL